MDNVAIIIILAFLVLFRSKLWRQGRKPLREQMPDLIEWYQVTFDDDGFDLVVTPPSREGWRARVLWRDITRVCVSMKADPWDDDEMLIFTSERPQSRVVPFSARGGKELQQRLIELDLFPAELAIEAAICIEDKLFCWPP